DVDRGPRTARAQRGPLRALARSGGGSCRLRRAPLSRYRAPAGAHGLRSQSLARGRGARHHRVVPRLARVAGRSAVTGPGRAIPNAVPHLRGNEWQYLKECLDTNWVSSVGPSVDRFAQAGPVVYRGRGQFVRGVRPVHLYGHPGALDAVLEGAGRYPLAVVEDAAEALGALYRGRRVGCEGLVSCLSFNGNKIITTGGGGMVLTRDDALARRVRSLTTQARVDAIEYVHEEIGYNYRLSNS